MSSAIGPATSFGQASSKMRPASSASSLEPRKKPASAVTTIKNGNSAIKVDSAIWLAIAQPSSARKCRKAAVTIRNDNLKVRNGLLRKDARPSDHLSAERLQGVPVIALPERGLGNQAACTLVRNCRTSASR